MVKFMNGLLRSNIHRVVAPPGVQGQEIRYSVVYFARPGDEVVLKRLEGSDVIPELKEGEKEEENDSKDWILLRALRLREVKDGMSDGEKKKLWEESGRGKQKRKIANCSILYDPTIGLTFPLPERRGFPRKGLP